MSVGYCEYISNLEAKLNELNSLTLKAREKGFDPSLNPESKIAKDLADLVEGLVGPTGVAESIRELSAELPREELAFKVTEQIVYGKFGHLEPEAAAEQAIRTALAIFTEGLTAAPIQGVAKVKIRTNSDRSRHLAIYFAGPIRSAGGTDQALTLVVGDFVRRLLKLDIYKTTEEEICRFIEELRLYERTVARFQYHISDEDLRRVLRFLPVEVTGTESDAVEVSTFRNLPRIETNRVRGGALRVVNDGIVGRAPKVRTIVEKLGFQGWGWLKDLQGKSEKSGGFMDEVIAGRPVFSFPSRRGGFRLRYGRARNSGLSAVGINPLTMLVLEDFLAGGTQLRMELPGKGGVVVPVDSIEGPVVCLDDDTVIRPSVDRWAEIKGRIKRILFLGDMLISFGDFLYNSKCLAPSGYVEEWWTEDLRNALATNFSTDVEGISSDLGISAQRLQILLSKPFTQRPTLNEALKLCVQLRIPLHPAFIHFWSNLTSIEQLKKLREWLLKSEIQDCDGVAQKIIGEADFEIKEALELICVPHRVSSGKIILETEDAATFALSLGYKAQCNESSFQVKTVLDAINSLSGVLIKDKAPTSIGARMGRPEKARRREMKPLVHVLFPVGLAGGSQRDLLEAAKRGPVFVEVSKRKCPLCRTYTSRVKCPQCGSETVLEKSCPKCGSSVNGDTCPKCRIRVSTFQRQVFNLKESLESACAQLSVSRLKSLKGVKGLTNVTKTPEMLEKGVLRAKHELSVYKDGTIRFDVTNAPLTHFKPSEINVSIPAVKKLGYIYDSKGADLEDPNQTCELKLQDIVIPFKAAEYFIRITGFLDELLVKVYSLPAFYNVSSIYDLVGHLIVGLAPHTCVGILGRVIGFTNLDVCYAHPIWHSAKRRDCDGDEDTVMLALDMLMNFSREYLPAQIGGIMDAPLLLIPVVRTQEVQRQAHDFDVAESYSLEFYEKTLQNAEAREASALVDLVRNRLGTEAQFEGFNYTTPVGNINAGNSESAYKRLKAMTEKLAHQLELAEKIDAVDADRVALKVLTIHFMRDIAGNLRAFSTQNFRCKSCSKRYRRMPLRGKCTSCGGQLALTVYRGGIEKYMAAARNLIEKYNLPKYYSERISLSEEEIDDLFESRKPRQINLTSFS
jgi:DNA polymerase II large subunit